jgi:hypothetical protein
VNGCVQLPLDGALRQAERLGDLTQLEPLVVAHDEHESLPLRQSGDSGLEHRTQFTRVRTLLGTWRLFRGIDHLLFGFLAKGCGTGGCVAPAMVDAGVHHDPVQPRAQLGLLAESLQRAVDLDKHFLRNVFRVVMVARELEGDAVHHRTMTLDERLEGGGVASRRPRDQVRIW